MATGHSTAKQVKWPIEWKLVLTNGAVLGGLAGLLSLFGKEWYNWVVPGGMMIASWWTVNRAAGRRFWSGFAASLLAGLLAWVIYLAVNYANLTAHGSFLLAVQLSAAFLLPLILIIGVCGSWLFSRTRERVLAAQKRMEEEKAKRKQMNCYRAKKHRKKK
ncbi:hypothetical protein [Effusibacillus pohliae]|uniref:hypothetical protein n=1 Tax=Effusibacillus pohliae TaxID=232270 RepID=UPI000375FDEA|nr:hypothetical protein [Effusibacillus pohliae]